MNTANIHFSGVVNALRTLGSARAIANTHQEKHPEQAIAVFHSGQDYAVFTDRDAELAKVMVEARNANTTNRDDADDINRRLDNWVADMKGPNNNSNTHVELVDYIEPRREML